MTFDLEHLWYIACDVMKLCTKFERSGAIRNGIIRQPDVTREGLKFCDLNI